MDRREINARDSVVRDEVRPDVKPGVEALLLRG